MNRTSEKNVVSEKSNIANFIAAISSKKYAQAHKYLQAVIEQKLQARISNSLNKPLF